MIERKQMSGHERKALQHMLAFWSQSAEHGDGLRERLKQMPNGWRDFRLMLSIAQKLISGLYETLTDAQLMQMRKMEQYGECNVRIRAAAKCEDLDFVHVKALKAVIRHCITANCGICVKTDAEMRGCELRKALQDICPPMDIPRFGCAYRDLISEIDLEDEL